MLVNLEFHHIAALIANDEHLDWQIKGFYYINLNWLMSRHFQQLYVYYLCTSQATTTFKQHNINNQIP